MKIAVRLLAFVTVSVFSASVLAANSVEIKRDDDETNIVIKGFADGDVAKEIYVSLSDTLASKLAPNHYQKTGKHVQCNKVLNLVAHRYDYDCRIGVQEEAKTGWYEMSGIITENF